jgi:glycosyltransferase involved in cell wall biosynthesis
MTARPRTGQRPRSTPGGSGQQPTISVITIFHDEERFLTDAIDSVTSQTGVDWELLLVDDGSTDTSPTLARLAARIDPDRIRYLTHGDGANRGMSASRNLGIAHARGRWLCFLDADDVWLPGKLAAQLAALDRHPGIEVLASPAQWWRSWPGAEAAGDDWLQTLGPSPAAETVVDAPRLLIDFLDDEWRSICDLVLSRRVVDAVGGYEPAFRGMYEDQAFHAKVLSRYPALVTVDSWYRYRQHDEACTANSHRGGAHGSARRLYLDWLDHHLRRGGWPDQHLMRSVRRHRRRAHHPELARIIDRVRALTS